LMPGSPDSRDAVNTGPDVLGDDGTPIPFRSHIDEMSSAGITGWVIRDDQPTDRCVVSLRENGQVLARAIASEFRADLAEAGIGDGCYRFNIPIPTSLLNGEEHLIEIVEYNRASC
jgi:hypothetical protein